MILCKGCCSFICFRGITELSCWTKGIIGVVIHLNKDTQFLCNEKANLGKKVRDDKTTNFSKESEY